MSKKDTPEAVCGSNIIFKPKYYVQDCITNLRINLIFNPRDLKDLIFEILIERRLVSWISV